MDNMTQKQIAFEALCKFIAGLRWSLYCSPAEGLEIEMFDNWAIQDAEDLEIALNDRMDSLFTPEISCTWKAVIYLTEEVCNIKEALYLAEIYGYETAQLSAELLAELLGAERNRQTWYSHADEINELIDEINFAAEEEEEEEEEADAEKVNTANA